MVTIFTSDGRTLSYEENEDVLVLGTFDGPSFRTMRKPVTSVNPGNWLCLAQCTNAADRDYDLVLVKNIAGKPVVESFAEWNEKRRKNEIASVTPNH